MDKRINIGDVLLIKVSFDISSIELQKDKICLGCKSGRVYIFNFLSYPSNHYIESEATQMVQHSETPVILTTPKVIVHQKRILAVSSDHKTPLSSFSIRSNKEITCCTDGFEFYGTNKGKVYYGLPPKKFFKAFLTKRDSNNSIAEGFLCTKSNVMEFGFSRKNNEIRSLGLSKNRQYLFVGGNDIVEIYCIRYKKVVASKEFSSAIKFLCSSAKQDKAMFFSADGRVFIWGKNGVKFTGVQNLSNISNAVHFKNDWLMCSSKNQLMLYNIVSKCIERTIPLKSSIINMKRCIFTGDTYVFCSN